VDSAHCDGSACCGSVPCCVSVCCVSVCCVSVCSAEAGSGVLSPGEVDGSSDGGASLSLDGTSSSTGSAVDTALCARAASASPDSDGPVRAGGSSSYAMPGAYAVRCAEARPCVSSPCDVD